MLSLHQLEVNIPNNAHSRTFHTLIDTEHKITATLSICQISPFQRYQHRPHNSSINKCLEQLAAIHKRNRLLDREIINPHLIQSRAFHLLLNRKDELIITISLFTNLHTPHRKPTDTELSITIEKITQLTPLNTQSKHALH